MSGEGAHKVLVAVKERLNKSALLSAIHPMSEHVHLTFYHVVELPLPSPMYSDLIEPVLEERRRSLRGFVEWAEEQGFKASLKVVAARDAFSSIVEELEREKYSLLVVQRVEKIARRLGLGVEEKLIRSLRIPILVLPPSE